MLETSFSGRRRPHSPIALASRGAPRTTAKTTRHSSPLSRRTPRQAAWRTRLSGRRPQVRTAPEPPTRPGCTPARSLRTTIDPESMRDHQLAADRATNRRAAIWLQPGWGFEDHQVS